GSSTPSSSAGCGQRSGLARRRSTAGATASWSSSLPWTRPDRERPPQEDFGEIRHRVSEVRMEILGGRIVGAVGDRTHFQKSSVTKTCRSCRPCAFPCDAERAGRLLQLERACSIDDVFITARNVAEQDSESRADVARRQAELVHEVQISLIARQRSLDEAKLVVVFDGRRADHDVAELQIRTETAGRSSADHRMNGRAVFDQVLRLNGVLRLAVSAHCEEKAKLVDEVTLEPPHDHTARAVAGATECCEDRRELIDLRHRYQRLPDVHEGYASAVTTFVSSSTDNPGLWPKKLGRRLPLRRLRELRDDLTLVEADEP